MTREINESYACNKQWQDIIPKKKDTIENFEWDAK